MIKNHAAHQMEDNVSHRNIQTVTDCEGNICQLLMGCETDGYQKRLSQQSCAESSNIL